MTGWAVAVKITISIAVLTDAFRGAHIRQGAVASVVVACWGVALRITLTISNMTSMSVSHTVIITPVGAF